MAPVQVCDRHREGELREPAEERPEGQVALHPGQWRTETVMDAVPESEMTGLVPFEIEQPRGWRIGLRPGWPPPGR